MLQVCPTDIVRAPAERVWSLVGTPRELARWSETELIDAPAREIRSGDRLVVGAGIGRRFQAIFRVERADRPRRDPGSALLTPSPTRDTLFNKCRTVPCTRRRRSSA